MKTTNQEPAMPLSVKIQVIKVVCGKLAKCATLFLRWGMGFREIDMAWIIGIAVFLHTFGGIFQWFSKRDFGGLYELYPVVLVATAFYQRRKQWKLIEAGQLVHSRADGVSFLESFTWLPAIFFKNRVIYRYCEPALIFVGSMLIGAFISQPLGRFMAFVGVADFVYEAALYEFRLNAALDILDGLVEAEGHQKTVEHFASGSRSVDSSTTTRVEVIASGVSDDLVQAIQRRRKEQAGRSAAASTST